ncbi:hypothetical protein NUW54_g13768 [Trametes sanguinea]|uniref:Uncharacterized protein n=1 Tax=Trametes sanguinea TaxID=158606 RepID=A0ACC1MHS6_9APHY|nr:hypothetical protein NUW54_g13768 [Trametes sanguinea]
MVAQDDSPLDAILTGPDVKAPLPKDDTLSASESETKTEIAPEDRPARPQVTTTTLELPGLRKTPSAASVGAISPSTVTPTTPALTPGASAATDDEETDFQSAYSTSPRGSYGSFENYNHQKGYDDRSEEVTPTGITGHHLDEFGTHQEVALKSRERNFSTSTATTTKARTNRLMARASEDTVGGQ